VPAELRHAGFVDLWHPGLIAVTLILAVAYLLTVGPWRGRFADSTAVNGRQQTAFFLALSTFYLAMGSPMDFLSDHLLMSAHMAEHMMLTFVMAPLLLLGTPGWLIRPVLLGRPRVRRVVERLTRPLTAMIVFNVVFSAVHLPGIYDLTLHNVPLHFTEHAVLIVTALLMWWPVLSPLPELPRLPDMTQIGYLFLNEVFQTIAFALITFADHPLYAVYAGAPQIWGITRMDDQQAGGLLMKLGAMAALVPAMWDAFFRWARRESAFRTDFTAVTAAPSARADTTRTDAPPPSAAAAQAAPALRP